MTELLEPVQWLLEPVQRCQGWCRECRWSCAVWGALRCVCVCAWTFLSDEEYFAERSLPNDFEEEEVAQADGRFGGCGGGRASGLTETHR